VQKFLVCQTKTLYKSRIDEREAWLRAQIADQKRRTEAEMAGLERRERTAQVERYVWMGLSALRLSASVVLAFELARAI
jgi:hypothetical protein